MTKKISLTVIFYLVAAVIIFLAKKSAPSGPCTPGLGIISFMLLPFVSGILLMVDLVKIYKGEHSNKISALLHFIFIVGFCVYLKLV